MSGTSKKISVLMSARQVAERLGVTTRTLNLWIKNGRFPAGLKHSGSSWLRWRRADVERWIDGNQAEGDRDRLATILLRAAEECSDKRVREWFRALANGESAESAQS
jgi:excisionase family DNA binding protein